VILSLGRWWVARGSAGRAQGRLPAGAAGRLASAQTKCAGAYQNRAVAVRRDVARDFASLEPPQPAPPFGTRDGTVQRRRRHVELLRDISDRQPLFAKRAREGNIDAGGRSSQADAPAACAFDAGLGAGDQLRSLLLCNPREDGDEQGTHRATGVEPRFANTEHLYASPIELQHSLEVPDHRAAEPIECPDEQKIEGAAVRVDHHRLELSTHFEGTGVFLVRRNDVQSSGPRESLQIRTLILRRLLLSANAKVHRRPRLHGPTLTRSGIRDTFELIEAELEALRIELREPCI
jgi:hypothetical protein